MKTTFAKLFTLIALTMSLAAGATTTASAQGRLIQGILEAIDNSQCQHPSHHNHHQQRNGQWSQSQGYPRQQQYDHQWQFNSHQNSPQQAPQAAIPAWLVGKWQPVESRVGGSTQYEFGADGTFTTINLITGTSRGTFESGRSTQSAAYTSSGLQIGNSLYQLSSGEPGKLTLTSSRGSFQIERVPTRPANTPVEETTLVSHTLPKVNVNKPAVADGSRVPVSMQGTWFEVTLNRKGDQILNKYVFNADATYDLSQYAISADGDVDLAQPIAQLSKLASAEKRTITIDARTGIGTLGAGQSFAEGPLQLAHSTDASGQTLLHFGDRKLTRTP